MNILILNWRDPKNPKSGGAEIVTLEHARAWVKKGHQVTWFTSSFTGALPEEKIEGVTIIRKGSSLTTYFHAPFYYLANREKIDLVIDEIHGMPFFTPLFVHKPKIAFIHEVAREIWDHMYPFPINVVGRIIESLYFKLYKNVPFWTDAESTIDDLVRQGIDRNNCIAINCPASNEPLRRPVKKEKIPTFIFVSRLVKMKGIEEVIKAFAIIRQDLPDAQLWLVGGGEGSYLKELQEMTTSLDLVECVNFLGRIPQEKKLALMGRAHLLLHASVKEGWGLVVIEAASQMTPSIVYNVAGLRDSVKDQKTGIVTKKNSPEALAKETVKLMSDKATYHRLQKNALGWATSLTWDDATRKSLRLLESL